MVEFVSINGAQLAYRLVGPENGPLIITLHGGRGFGDHKSDFKAYSPLSSSYRVLSFDFRGHGQSSRTEPFTFHQIVEDIEGLRRHFLGADQPCIICGGSFGGFLAQQYAVTYPSRVSHLILRGTAPSHHHEETAIRTLEQRASKAPGLSIKFLKDKIFGRFESDLEFRLVMYAAAPLYSEHFDPDVALKHNIETVFYAKSHNDLYAEQEKYFDYRDQLHSITAKTLVIVGERDWICPPEQSKTIASKIPGAELRVIANANHGVHLEKNAEVIELIKEHIR
ncbi:Alpha/beta hydrolase fold-1 [Penicillium expansum]|uniref:Alpha/beta hydrolase fold-1 n=1 Tax=Penicillium expansum TaxID=27334 RepID=A0A0A2JL60_PENEN|nr:Alpha/beta hydrolase fold-1 [Penicillium expansum]KGO55398.1 Alpha/beta hydrolase fold-1 [Penicillium expansum]